MKKILWLIIPLILTSAFASHAQLTADTNVAEGKAAYGTFANAYLVTDGKLKLGATSSDLSESPQYLTVDIGSNMYIDRVKVYWDATAYSGSYVVKTSSDAKYWQEEVANLDAGTGVPDAASNTIAQSISLKKAIVNTRYVQVMVPAGTKVVNARGQFVKVNEIEVFPATALKFTLGTVSPYLVANNMCIIKYDTSLGAASGTISYGTDPNKLDTLAANTESGVENHVVLSALKPRTNYFYQVRTSDYYGNAASSKVLSFATVSDNVALGRSVTGTFTLVPPKDRFVKAGSESEILQRITDGGTSYFTSMATSGPIPSADQFVLIDLGRSYRIRNIVSYWRRLAYPESLDVSVSEDNSKWASIAEGANAGSGGVARSDTGDPMIVLNSEAATDVSARYVKLLVKKDSPFFHKHSDWTFVQLMEVQVFAK